MIMTGIVYLRVAACVLGRIVSAWGRNGMTCLTKAVALCIHVFPLTAGITEKYLAGLSGLVDIATDQVDVGSLGICRIVLVVCHMGAVTVITLNVLSFYVMAPLACMTIGTDIQLIWLPAQNRRPSPVGTQKIAITAAQVGKVVSAVNAAAARISVR